MSNPNPARTARPAEPATEAQVRAAVAEAVVALATALTVAAVVVAVLMLMVFLRSGTDGHSDFPGRYLLTLLPLLAAAGMLRLLAAQIGKVLT